MLSLAGRSARQVEEFVTELARDGGAPGVTPADAVMLAYVAKLTRTPAAVTADDVTPLRTAGFDDRAIHDICAIAAYYAFVNRIADGLGVELEARFPG